MELSGTHLHLLKKDIELIMSFVQDCTPLHHQKSILLKMLFRFFSVTILLRKYWLCSLQTCKVDGLLRNGMLLKRRNYWLLLVFSPFRSRKNWDLDTRQLFLDPKQNPTYKVTFGVNRFENVRCHLRFNNKRTRAERVRQDKLAAFNYIWGLFIQICKTQFSLGAYTTVDEQLVPFRGRCPFTQYMQNKPAKYGIKIFWLCDGSLPYAFNAKIYVGRQPGSALEKNLGHSVVVNLTTPLQGSGRNVSIHNFFTSVPVARTLLQHQLTVVGTMKKCKREIRVCMKAAKS